MPNFRSLQRLLLALPAAGYYSVQKTREIAYRFGIVVGRSVPVPVVSVGNILMGGSGKTPCAILLARMFLDRGMRPAVISRGYKGSYRSSCLVVSDGLSADPLVGAARCGDEPFLMASRLPGVPVIVGRRRFDPVIAALDLFQPDVVILDDAFQHLPLARDLDIVLLSGAEDHMFPLGGLREPFSALRRAHVILYTGKEATLPGAAAPFIQGKPVFRCRVVPSVLVTAEGEVPCDSLAGREVILLSGIARPHRFAQTALELGWIVKDHISFPDHHVFTEEEVQAVLDKAGGLPVIVTEKDWVKLPATLKEVGRLFALRIEMMLDEEARFWERVLAAVTRAGGM